MVALKSEDRGKRRPESEAGRRKSRAPDPSANSDPRAPHGAGAARPGRRGPSSPPARGPEGSVQLPAGPEGRKGTRGRAIWGRIAHPETPARREVGTVREGERQVEGRRQGGGQPRRLAARRRFKTTVGRLGSWQPRLPPGPALTRCCVPASPGSCARGAVARAPCSAATYAPGWLGRAARLGLLKRRDSAARRRPQHVAASGESLRAEAAHPSAAEQGEGRRGRASAHLVAPSVQSAPLGPAGCGTCVPGTRAEAVRAGARGGRSFGFEARGTF